MPSADSQTIPSPAAGFPNLKRLSRRLHVAAIVRTLPHASPSERRELAAMLLDLCASPPSLIQRLRARLSRWTVLRRISLFQPAPDPALALAQSWDRLPDDLRAVARSILATRLAELASTLAGSPDASERIAAGAIIADAPAPETLRLLPALIGDRRAGVAERAEAAMLSIARTAELSNDSRAALDEALASAARAFPEHRRRGVMDAAALLMETPGPHLAGFLEEKDQPAHLALRAAVRRSSGADGRARCIRLLNHPLVSAAALDRLLQPADDCEHAAGLREWHRLLVPTRLREIRRAARPWRALPEPARLASLDEGARRSTPRWMALLALKEPRRSRRLEALLVDLSPRVRWAAAALAADAAHKHDAAAGLTQDFAFDPSPDVARTAARALVGGSNAPGPVFWSRLARRETPDLAALATREQRDRDPWSWLDDPHGLTPPLGARRLLMQDREALVAGLRRVISSEEPPDRRLRGVALARRLAVCDELEEELIAMTGGEDARLVATAVRALGGVETDAARAALVEARAHSDGRVRASAIEAMGAWLESLEPIIEAVRDETARARANAVRAMLKREIEAGGEQLAAMLRDDRPGHRVSALWVAERVGGGDHAHIVADLARSDAEAPVRERAKRCARRLLARMRDDWAGGAREKGAALHA